MRLCLALWAVTVLAGHAGAATYYVDVNNPRAADTNPGTVEQPFKSITPAAKAAGAGDTVLIKGGTYRETVVLTKSGEKDKPITIQGSPGERVILTGAEKITGWRKCAKDEVAGNENSDKIYTVDLDWEPERLLESSANWGDKKVNWDLRLQDTSPGHGKASDGTDMGSSVNLQNYMKGDFSGEGKRVLPVLPKE